MGYTTFACGARVWFFLVSPKSRTYCTYIYQFFFEWAISFFRGGYCCYDVSNCSLSFFLCPINLKYPFPHLHLAIDALRPHPSFTSLFSLVYLQPCIFVSPPFIIITSLVGGRSKTERTHERSSFSSSFSLFLSRLFIFAG